MCSVAQIIEHRLARESLVRRVEPRDGTPIDTEFGRFTLIAYESVVDALPHLALVVGDVGHDRHAEDPTLVRMHRRDLLGDIFAMTGGADGSSSAALRSSMRAIQREGRGAIVYLRPEGAPDALASQESLSQRLQRIKRTAYDPNAPDLTHPASPAAAAAPMHNREFGIGCQILRDLGLRKLRVLTNHPRTMPGLEAFGLEVAEHVALDA